MMMAAACSIRWHSTEFGRATMATCSVVFNEPRWLRDPADLFDQALWWIGPAVLVQNGRFG
jgi:hypothetical protein